MKYQWLVVVLVIVFGLLALGYARAAGTGVKAGDRAPSFALAGSDGKVHSLSDLEGRTIVIAWFPKAFTGG